jgi:hypothetical protein
VQRRPSSSPTVSGRKTIVTCPRPIYELEEQIIADARDVIVLPSLEWIRGLPASLGVIFLLIRRAVENVHVAPIGTPARTAGCRPKMLGGKRDPAIVLFLEFVFRSTGFGSRRNQNCSINFTRSSSVVSLSNAARSLSSMM